MNLGGTNEGRFNAKVFDNMVVMPWRTGCKHESLLRRKNSLPNLEFFSPFSPAPHAAGDKSSGSLCGGLPGTALDTSRDQLLMFSIDLHVLEADGV